MEIVSYQEALRPELPTVIGNVDYQQFRAALLRMEQILEQSGLERLWIEESVEQYRQEAKGSGRDRVSRRELARVAEHAVGALRCNMVRQLIGDCCRAFSVRLADSPLLQRFCGIARIDVVKVPSKSTLDRYARWAPEETGFDLQANRSMLLEQGLYNAIAPRSPRRFAERMREPAIARLQRRRGQTETRVSNFKNGFLGRPMRSKGFWYRHNQVAWAVLAHNLWVSARLPTAAEQREQREQFKRAA